MSGEYYKSLSPREKADFVRSNLSFWEAMLKRSPSLGPFTQDDFKVLQDDIDGTGDKRFIEIKDRMVERNEKSFGLR